MPCPVCDIALLKPIEALALGVALGASHSDMHAVTELMCKEHRQPYLLAMVRASMVANSVEPVRAP